MGSSGVMRLSSKYGLVFRKHCTLVFALALFLLVGVLCLGMVG